MNSVHDDALKRFNGKIFGVAHGREEGASAELICPRPGDGICDGIRVARIDGFADEKFRCVRRRIFRHDMIKP